VDEVSASAGGYRHAHVVRRRSGHRSGARVRARHGGREDDAQAV